MYIYTYNNLTDSNIKSVDELPEKWVDFFNSIREEDIKRYWILTLLKSNKSAKKVSIITGLTKDQVTSIYRYWGMRLKLRIIPKRYIKL